jgi:hypothetical protein
LITRSLLLFGQRLNRFGYSLVASNLAFSSSQTCGSLLEGFLHIAHCFSHRLRRSLSALLTFSLLTFSLLTFSLLTFSLLTFSLLTFSLLTFSLLTFSLGGFGRSFCSGFGCGFGLLECSGGSAVDRGGLLAKVAGLLRRFRQPFADLLGELADRLGDFFRSLFERIACRLLSFASGFGIASFEGFFRFRGLALGLASRLGGFGRCALG